VQVGTKLLLGGLSTASHTSQTSMTSIYVLLQELYATLIIHSFFPVNTLALTT
jgi:hypothetical protein